jgi:hypothetical protein
MQPNKFISWSLVPACFAIGLLCNRMLVAKPATTRLPQVPVGAPPATTESPAPGRAFAALQKNWEPASSGRPATEKPNGLIYDDFPQDPFPITRSSDHHSWTSINAISPKDIDSLAHNDHERERHLTENFYVVRRELVYRKTTFRDVAESHLAAGTQPETVLLPGFDGQEYEVVVKSWEASPANAPEREGVFNGHLKDDPDSQVHLAYYEGSETGYIISERLGLHLAIDPREPRQIMVKQIDPELEAMTQQGLECGSKYSDIAVGSPNSLPE